MDKTIANQNYSKVIGRLAELARRLEEEGLPYEALQRPIDDKEMRHRLVRFWIAGGFESSLSQKRAREIMGKNMFGIEEAIKHFEVNPSREQLAALADVPFSEEVLASCKDTHILVAFFPLSLLDIRGKVESQRLFYDQSWYNKQAFAKDRGEVSWHLVLKTPVPDSTSKNWTEQQSLLGSDDETPFARVMAYTIIGHYLATGEWLFEKIYVRCSEVDSYGQRVDLGLFDEDGLDVNSIWDNFRSDNLGLSSARKSN